MAEIHDLELSYNCKKMTAFYNLSQKGRRFRLFQYIMLCNVSLLDGSNLCFSRFSDIEAVFYLTYFM